MLALAGAARVLLACGGSSEGACDGGACASKEDARGGDARQDARQDATRDVSTDSRREASNEATALEAQPASVSFIAGASVSVNVTVTRPTAALTLAIVGLPQGVSSSPPSASVGADGGTVAFTLEADVSAPVASVNALVLASGAEGVVVADTELAVSVVNAGDGLQSSFGSNGQELIPVSSTGDAAGPTNSSYVYRLRLLPDDSFLSFGAAAAISSPHGPKEGYAIGHFDSLGRPESTFGSMGTVFTSLPSFTDVARNGYVLADGGIVAGGYSHVGIANALSSVRYSASGALDPSYGQCDGGPCFFSVPIDGGQVGTVDLANQSGSAVMVAGLQSAGGDTVAGACLTRLTPAGQLDPSFGDAGWSCDGSLYANGVVEDPSDGSLFVVGAVCPRVVVGTSTCTTNVVKYGASGMVDATFGDSGVLVVPVRTGEGAFNDASIALDPHGDLLIASSTYDAGASQPSMVSGFSLQVARVLLPAGTLDGSFGVAADAGAGSSGVVEIPLGAVPCDEYCGSPRLAVQADGKIVVADTYNLAGGAHAAVLLRLDSAGALDPSFGSRGSRVYSAIAGHDTYANDVVVEKASGTIVLAGNVATFEGETAMYLAGFVDTPGDASAP